MMMARQAGAEIGIPFTSIPLKGNDCNPQAGVSELLHAAAYSAVEQPLEGCAQWINHATAFHLEKPDLVAQPMQHDGWTAAGSLVGGILDYMLLTRVLGGARQALAPNLRMHAAVEAGVAGAAYELAMPVNDRNFTSQKMIDATTGFLTFATMTGASCALRSSKWLSGGNRFFSGLAANSASGALGGGVHCLAESWLNDRPVNYYALAGDSLQYSLFSAGFGALDHGLAAAGNRVATGIQSRVDSGSPLFSLGPVEIHPRGYATRATELAYTDELTQLRNKSGGAHALQTEVARAQRHGEPLALTYLDLDNFKKVNDVYRHAAGDAVLQEIAQAVRAHYKRATDVHVREGGDEFMVIMPDTSLANAADLAEQLETSLRIGVSEHGIRCLHADPPLHNCEVVVGVSSGVVALQPGESPAQFKERADKLMLEKKKQRKALGLRYDREDEAAESPLDKRAG